MDAVLQPTRTVRSGAERQVAAAAVFLSPALLMITVMLLAPLALILRFSLNQYDLKELMIETVTGANYWRFVSDPFYVGVLRTTLGVAVTSTARACCWACRCPTVWRGCAAGGRRYACSPS